jgi:hypothetical protein
MSPSSNDKDFCIRIQYHVMREDTGYQQGPFTLQCLTANLYSESFAQHYCSISQVAISTNSDLLSHTLESACVVDTAPLSKGAHPYYTSLQSTHKA